MDTKNEWILTDPDSFQICRRLSADAFELYQVQATSDEEDSLTICSGIIYIEDIDQEDICNVYGYQNLETMKKTYGDAYEQILAECEFELLCAGGECFISNNLHMSWEEAVNIIRRLSGCPKDFNE